MTKKKYTIKDIAHLAGVSKGTVDRVLHKRGKVSKKSYQRVEKVLMDTEFAYSSRIIIWILIGYPPIKGLMLP